MKEAQMEGEAGDVSKRWRGKENEEEEGVREGRRSLWVILLCKRTIGRSQWKQRETLPRRLIEVDTIFTARLKEGNREQRGHSLITSATLNAA